MFGIGMNDYDQNPTPGIKNKLMVQSLLNYQGLAPGQDATMTLPNSSHVATELQKLMTKQGADATVYSNRVAYGGRGMHRVLTKNYAEDTVGMVLPINFNASKKSLSAKFKSKKERSFMSVTQGCQVEYLRWSVSMNDDRIKEIPKLVLFSGKPLREVQTIMNEAGIGENFSFVEVDFKKETGFKDAATVLIHEFLDEQFRNSSSITNTTNTTNTTTASDSEGEQIEGEGEMAEPASPTTMKKVSQEKKKKGAFRRLFARMKRAIF